MGVQKKEAWLVRKADERKKKDGEYDECLCRVQVQKLKEMNKNL